MASKILSNAKIKKEHKKLLLSINGKDHWMDFDAWNLEKEWFKELQGLPNEYDKLKIEYDKNH